MSFLSIITPLHNKESYIAETIESVLSQSFRDWEMIIVENHSSDDGPIIAKKFAEQDSRLRFFEAPPEICGPASARNYGLERATGEWVLFLDADDLLLPKHLKKMYEATQSHPEATLVSCDWLEGRELDLASNTRKYPTNKDPKKEYAASAIAYTPWVPHAAWMKRELLGEAPCWDEDFDSLVAEDHVFWFKILLNAKANYSPHLGVFYRIDAKNRRHNLSNYLKYVRVVDLAFQKNIELLNKANKKLRYHHRKMLINAYMEMLSAIYGDRELEAHILARIAEFKPNLLEAFRHWDAATVSSHFLPAKIVARIQKRRREMASIRHESP